MSSDQASQGLERGGEGIETTFYSDSQPFPAADRVLICLPVDLAELVLEAVVYGGYKHKCDFIRDALRFYAFKKGINLTFYTFESVLRESERGDNMEVKLAQKKLRGRRRIYESVYNMLRRHSE
jgi:Arc/MetJ-type ribon-helix-helix transcriptional regulator